MPIAAPLRVTVEVKLRSGDARGQRRFRLSSQLELPARLALAGPLPIDGEGTGRVRFPVPDAAENSAAATRWIEADAQLRFDPEQPQRGAAVMLLGLDADDLQCLETYVQQRVQS